MRAIAPVLIVLIAASLAACGSEPSPGVPADVAAVVDAATDMAQSVDVALDEGPDAAVVDASPAVDTAMDVPRDTGCPPNAERTSSGSCRCVSGFTSCDGACRDLFNDNAACGRCGAICDGGICALGRCVTVAPPVDAGSDATDAASDRPDRCAGACMTLANTIQAECVAVNRCAILRCSAGFSDCDGLDLNGCETNTLTSDGNCGACRQLCTGGRMCRNGMCSF